MASPSSRPVVALAAALALTACASESYDPGNAAQGGPVNRQASSVAESACMSAVNDKYSGNFKSLRVVRSEFSQANSEVIVQADAARWRCLVSDAGDVQELSQAR